MKALYDIRVYPTPGNARLKEHSVRMDSDMAISDIENYMVSELRINDTEFCRNTAISAVRLAEWHRGEVINVASVLGRRIEVIVTKGEL